MRSGGGLQYLELNIAAASAMVSSLEDVNSNKFLRSLGQESKPLDDRAFLKAYDAYRCSTGEHTAYELLVLWLRSNELPLDCARHHE